jgi:hypothetical protein
MPIWWRRILAITTLGGGFTGVVITLAVIFSAEEKPLVGTALAVFATLFYAYGTALGLALAEGRNPRKQLLIYYGFQIPIFGSPDFAYHFFSGFYLCVVVSGGQFGANFQLGSEWALTFHQMSPWTLGINLFGLAVVITLLIRRPRKKPEQAERSLSSPFSDY